MSIQFVGSAIATSSSLTFNISNNGTSVSDNFTGSIYLRSGTSSSGTLVGSQSLSVNYGDTVSVSFSGLTANSTYTA